MSGKITAECLTAREAADGYGFEIDAEFCYVVVSEGFTVDGRPEKAPLPGRTAVVCQAMIYRRPDEGVVWDGNWAVEFIEDGEPQCRFPVSTLDDALCIAKDYCCTGRGQGVLL